MRQPSTGEVLALTGFGSLLVSLDVSVANSLLPAIGDSFAHPSRAALSWVITAYALVFAAALVPAGRLADRVGRRRVFLGGLAVFGLASLGCGVAPGLGWLVAARLLQGAGAAALSPASLGLLLHATPAARRSVSAARWGGMGALGIGSGPLLGGVATDLLSWRWAFLVNVPVVGLLLLAGRGRLPETDRQAGSRLPDPLGVALLAGGTAALVLAVTESSAWGLTDARELVAGLGGLAALGLFARRSLRVPEPVLDLELLRDRQVAAVTVVSLAYSAAFFGLLYGFVAFLAGPWHLSLTRVGLALLPMAGTVAPLALVVGQLADRVGFRLPIAGGALLMAAGLLLHARLDALGGFAPRWLPETAVVGVGVGLCYPLLGAATVAGLHPRLFAAASAVNQTARQVGAALGIAVVVAVLGPTASVADFHRAWAVGAVVCLVAAVAGVAVQPRPAPAVPPAAVPA